MGYQFNRILKVRQRKGGNKKMKVKVLCPFCRGGKIQVQCGVCEGTGYLPERAGFLAHGYCPECKGTGYVEKLCSKCKGESWLEMEVREEFKEVYRKFRKRLVEEIFWIEEA